MLTAIDGTTTLKFKFTVGEWLSIGSVFVAFIVFIVQGDRRITQVENVSQASLEQIVEAKADIKDINQSLSRIVDIQLANATFKQQLEDLYRRLDRLQVKVDANP